MITNNHAQLTKILNNLQVNTLAQQTGFTIRQARKIHVESFLSGFFQMMFSGSYSLRLWASNIATIYGGLISFQAIAKKLDFRHEPFFHALFQKALMTKMENRLNFKVHEILDSFRRVIVEDSTCFKLPSALFDFFPGARLPHGRTAGGRVQLRIDLKQHNYESIALESYCQNDIQFAEDVVRTLEQGDLIIRDLGYFVVPVFSKIMAKGAYFLSRLSLTTNVLCPENERVIDLVSFLRKKEQQGIKNVDMPVLLSNKYKIPVRFVAIKLTDQQANNRRQMAKTQRHKKYPISPNASYLLSWNLFITNVQSSIWDVPSLYHAYTLRWHIEMIFKCWKSKFNFNAFFKHCHGRNPVKPEILLLLILTWIVLFFMPSFNRFANTIWKYHQRILSPLRFAHYIKANPSLILLNADRKVFKLLAYHCCYDRRKDRLNHFEKTYMNFLS